MKFGVCKSYEYAKDLKNAGFDYIEINLAKTGALSEQEFLNNVNDLKTLGFYAETSNCFFPSDIMLVGENVDYEKIKEYAQLVLERAHVLGVEVAVLGSGSARRVPDGFDADVAIGQFKKVVEICAEIAKKYDIKIAVEPLREHETNLLNTVSQTLEFCKSIDYDNVGIAADFFHMCMNGESMQDFENAKEHILHLHIAKPDISRIAPSQEDADTLKVWAKSIKKIGYNGRMSLECTSKADFFDSIKSMSEVKYIFE